MKIGLLFPGQGSQDLSLFENYPGLFSSYLQKISAVTGKDIEDILENKDPLLNNTKITQPFLLGVSYAIYEQLYSALAGHEIVFYAGHSLGELTAVCLAHRHPLEQGLKLALKRAHLMEEALDGKDTFCMLVALGINAQKAQEAISGQDKVYLVNDNTEEQVVLALLEDKKEAISLLLKEAGAKKLLTISMSVISHCQELQSAATLFYQELLTDFPNHSSQLITSVLSNVNAEQQNDTTTIMQSLALQLATTVRFKEMILNNAEKVDCFIEVGCHRVLTGLLKKITDKPCYSTHDKKALENLISYLKTGELVI